MSTLPPRAQLRLFNLPGPRAIGGFVIFILSVAAFASLGIAKNMPEPLLLVMIFGFLIPS